jgi:hypothetical protein
MLSVDASAAAHREYPGTRPGGMPDWRDYTLSVQDYTTAARRRLRLHWQALS